MADEPSAEALEAARAVRSSGAPYAMTIDYRYNKTYLSGCYEVFVGYDAAPIDETNPNVVGRFATKGEAVSEVSRLRNKQIDTAYARAIDAFRAAGTPKRHPLSEEEVARLEAKIKPIWLETKPSREAQYIRSEVLHRLGEDSDWFDLVCDLFDIAAQRGIEAAARRPASDLEWAAALMEKMSWPSDWPEHGKVNYYPTIAGALAEARAAGAPKPDDPDADATDAAHPAWWRGNDAGVAVTVARLTDILDGKDDGEGVIGYAPLEALRRRLLVLAAKPDASDAYTSARVLLKLREIQSRPDYSGGDEADCIAAALAEARAAGVAARFIRTGISRLL